MRVLYVTGGHMHDDDLPLDENTAATIIREQFDSGVPKVTALHTAATTNHIFRVGANLLARFPRQRADAVDAAGALAREQKAMDEFADACPFPAPRIVFVGRPSAQHPMPWSVQTWVAGEVMTPVSAASSGEVAHDLATLVTALRGTDTRGRRFAGGGRGGDLRAHDEWVAHCLAQSESLLPTRRLADLWAELRTTPRAEPDVMAHKDLIPFNLLTSATQGGGLAGVIDTGGFGPADPALDLVAGWHVLDAGSRARFRDAIGSGEHEWRRGMGWALQQALGLVWYYEKSNPTMSALGRTTIGRILDAEDKGR